MRNGAERTLDLLEAQVGRHVSEIETPAAVIDLDQLGANLHALQAYADEHRIALWPHAKTHKSPEIGLQQMELGAAGLTVAKTGEAEVFHEAGVACLLVHYPAIHPDKCERLAGLAAEGLDLTVAVDSLAGAEGLSAALDRHGTRATLLVELDVGLHRTGEQSPGAALELAQRLSSLPAVQVAGISCYPGFCHGDRETIRSQLAGVDAFMRETRNAFIAGGLVCDRISGGSTPGRYLTHETCVNELRAGTYALLDRNEYEPDGGRDACALWIQVTVVSDRVPNQIVVDAGSKTLTSDGHPDGRHGEVYELPDARVHTLNEEHAYVDVAGVADRPAVGDRLRLIPNHACGCVNMHDGLLGVHEGVVERVIAVSARGLVR